VTECKGTLQRRVILVMTVVVVAILVTVVVLVPMVVVFEAAMVSVPVTRIKLLSIMVGFNPSRAFIRRPRPVAVMPPVVVADRIPVTAYPGVLRARALGFNVNHTGTWWRTNSDTKRNLSL
jgi:hypothetical protein